MLKCQLLQFISVPVISVSAHRQHCAACQAETRQEALVERLLRQRAQAINEQAHPLSHDFMHRLSARLRVEAEPYLTTWEHAALALRGWIVTFSAVALLLVAFAATLALNSDKPEEHAFTASAAETGQNDAFWMGD